MELRPRGPAGRVRGGARDARPRPHARLAPPAARLADAGADPARGGRALASHIETLVGRYAGRIASWDVVNEAVADGGGPARRPCFLRACGAGYIAEAFRRAHAADPGARLYYNDYGAEGRGRKSDAVYALVRRLLDAGVPVHGVGLQMHLRAARPPGPPPSRPTWRGSSALGLEVRISEMDVRIRRIRREGSPRPPAPRVPRRDRGLRGDAGLRGRDVLGRERPALVDPRRVRRGRSRSSSIGTTRRSPPTSACATRSRRLRRPRPDRSRTSSRRTRRTRSRSPPAPPPSPSTAGPSDRARRGPRSSRSGRS